MPISERKRGDAEHRCRKLYWSLWSQPSLWWFSNVDVSVPLLVLIVEISRLPVCDFVISANTTTTTAGKFDRDEGFEILSKVFKRLLAKVNAHVLAPWPPPHQSYVQLGTCLPQKLVIKRTKWDVTNLHDRRNPTQLRSTPRAVSNHQQRSHYIPHSHFTFVSNKHRKCI